ncbi:MAG: NADH-quinone oxidoreductase subunit L [Rubrivivax sp.]|nr:NADH-quinone oxidoreductase subunit L [Rubrivivax sp.]
MVENIFLLTLLLPLAAALMNGLNLLMGDRWFSYRAVQGLTVSTALAAFAGSVVLGALMLADPTPRRIVLYEWMAVGDKAVEVAFLLDSLSVLMMTMVSGFAFVIGKFSVNYMHREQGFTRYFAAFSMFIFSMLLLVTGSNYAMLFVGWEAVGVCSYLLIGQYNDRVSAARASTEAFVANRVGDAGFLVGIFAMLQAFGTLDYAAVAAAVPRTDEGTLTFIGLCLLLGAVGKSAQLPLGSWLAKAMEGPTPSSALIHAATMVTAGVYLIVRSQVLYDAAPDALLVVAIVGAATALYGALVGQAVSDIKGLLATSTTTQLGFMFLACGLGAYAVAVFHMVAHAFMKSYLFLTAPSILHHLHGKLDPVRQEAAPRLPTAYMACVAAAAALVVLPLAGELGGLAVPAATWLLVAGGVMALGSAASYAVSLVRHTFDDGHHGADAQGHDAHDAASKAGHGTLHAAATAPQLPLTMLLWPLGLIAAAAAGGVALQVFPGGLEGGWFRSLLGPIVRDTAVLGDAAPALRGTLAVLLVAMVAFSAVSALYLGRFRAETAVPLVRHRRLYVAALNRFWLDALVRALVQRVVCRLGTALDRFDSRVVDRLVMLPLRLAESLSGIVRWLDEHVVTAVERLPRAVAGHAFAAADALDRHGIGFLEWGTQRLLFALARLGLGLERLLVALETALLGARGERGGPVAGLASTERAVARGLVGMFSAAVAIAASIWMVN